MPKLSQNGSKVHNDGERCQTRILIQKLSKLPVIVENPQELPKSAEKFRKPLKLSKVSKVYKLLNW